MANYLYLILGVLAIGGFIGWTLFFLTVVQTYISRKKEMEIIIQLRDDIKCLKEDVGQLK